MSAPTSHSVDGAVAAIIGAIEVASKCYHNSKQWDEPLYGSGEQSCWDYIEAAIRAALAAQSDGPEGEATEAMVMAGRDAMVAYLFGDCPGETLAADAQLEALRRAYRAMAAAALSGATERSGK